MSMYDGAASVANEVVPEPVRQEGNGELAPVIALRRGPQVSESPMLLWARADAMNMERVRAEIGTFLGRGPVSRKWVNRAMQDGLPFRKTGEHRQSPPVFLWMEVRGWLLARETKIG